MRAIVSLAFVVFALIVGATWAVLISTGALTGLGEVGRVLGGCEEVCVYDTTASHPLSTQQR